MYMTPNYSYWSRDRSRKENRNLKNWPHSRARERERERERDCKVVYYVWNIHMDVLDQMLLENAESIMAVAKNRTTLKL